MSAIYIIPRPPSINSYYANNKSGKGRGRYITDRGNTWRRAAMNELAAQKARRFGRPAVVTLCVPESNRRADIDNLIKPALDLLVKAKVLDDDNSTQVREVRARWVPAHLPCRVELEAA